MKGATLWMLAWALGAVEVVDRIAVTVDEHVITLSDLCREIRLTAFLDGAPVEFTAARKREAAERLIEQHLLERDMELTRFPAPEPSEVRQFIEQVRSARAPDAAAWRAELARYQLEETVVREHLARRLAVLRYIEFRFRPEVQLSEGEVDQYLRRRVLLMGQPLQPTDPEQQETRRAAQAALAAERINQLADRWLAEAKRRARIRYREGAFQ